MLENTVRWRRGYRPDELDPEYIKPEVFFFRYSLILKMFLIMII